MTVLSALQEAAIELVKKRPQTFFSSTLPFEMEMCRFANVAARDIMASHDWRDLMLNHTLTGDGVTTAFPVPADYDRMATGSDVSRPDWAGWRFTAASLEEWQDIIAEQAAVYPGYWIMMGGNMNFYPAIPSGETAQFYYISNGFAIPQSGARRSAFQADTDRFALDENLLTLAVIWRWRARQGLPYEEDMANYSKALSEKMARDAGARIIRGGNRLPTIADVGQFRRWGV